MAESVPAPIDHEFLQRVDVLYRAISRWLIRVAKTKTGNYADAEDAVQNSFVSLLEERSLPADAETEPKRFMYQRVCNDAIDIRRSRMARRLSKEPIEDLDLIAAPASGPESGRTRRLRHAMNRIDRKTSEIVILRYWLGYTLEAIGKEKGLATSTVDSILRRALESLRKHILMEERQIEWGTTLPGEEVVSAGIAAG